MPLILRIHIGRLHWFAAVVNDGTALGRHGFTDLQATRRLMRAYARRR